MSQGIGKNFFPRSGSYSDKDDLTYRIPLAVAMVSVFFEGSLTWLRLALREAGAVAFDFDDFERALLFVSSAGLCLFQKTSRLGVVLFAVTASYKILPNWMTMANHTWLAMWSIPMAMFFGHWWRSDLYSLYLRVTLGMVMLAAFAQKILAGTYIDGTYIYWLSVHGAATERLFSFACDMSAGVPCLAHKVIGQIILVWQLAVGVLLLLGVKALLFLAIEIGFLIGAGLYADEMNFQVLVIALLCIVFQVGMPNWLLAACLALLTIDLFTISRIVAWIQNVS